MRSVSLIPTCSAACQRPAASPRSKFARRQALTSRSMPAVADRHTLLLVHGNFSASWSWFDLVPKLKARGYDSSTVDLTWQQADSGRRPTLEDHVQEISGVITSQKLKNVVLVAHSYAGVPVQRGLAGTSWQRCDRASLFP